MDFSRLRASTIPGLLVERARARPARVAFRAKELGAGTYGIYPTSAPGEVRYLLEHGGARVVIVEDQEHLDKTLAVLDDAPGVRGVIVVDTRALFMYRSTRVHRFADIEAA